MRTPALHGSHRCPPLWESGSLCQQVQHVAYLLPAQVGSSSQSVVQAPIIFVFPGNCLKCKLVPDPDLLHPNSRGRLESASTNLTLIWGNHWWKVLIPHKWHWVYGAQSLPGQLKKKLSCPSLTCRDFDLIAMGKELCIQIHLLFGVSSPPFLPSNIILEIFLSSKSS